VGILEELTMEAERIGKWEDKAKMPPKESTLKMEANFREFTDMMKQIVNKRPRDKPKTASPGPAVS
jgi:hypothetical protein